MGHGARRENVERLLETFAELLDRRRVRAACTHL